MQFTIIIVSILVILTITTDVLMDASGYQSYIHFDRKPWSFDQGFFGFVGSLKPRKRGGSNIEKIKFKNTKGGNEL